MFNNGKVLFNNSTKNFEQKTYTISPQICRQMHSWPMWCTIGKKEKRRNVNEINRIMLIMYSTVLLWQIFFTAASPRARSSAFDPNQEAPNQLPFFFKWTRKSLSFQSKWKSLSRVAGGERGSEGGIFLLPLLFRDEVLSFRSYHAISRVAFSSSGFKFSRKTPGTVCYLWACHSSFAANERVHRS